MTFHPAKESVESTMAETLAAKVTRAPLIAVRHSRDRVAGVAWMNAAKGTRVIWIS